jgi:hypothetical protein
MSNYDWNTRSNLKSLLREISQDQELHVSEKNMQSSQTNGSICMENRKLKIRIISEI